MVMERTFTKVFKNCRLVRDYEQITAAQKHRSPSRLPLPCCADGYELPGFSNALLVALIDVLKAGDVVLAEIGASLHLDELERNFARVF